MSAAFGSRCRPVGAGQPGAENVGGEDCPGGGQDDGVGMVAAILIDATIVRMLLVPAVMQLLGRRNWWQPRTLERWMPQLHVEGRPDTYLPPHDDAEPTPSTAQ
jgi:hypothetical protein